MCSPLGCECTPHPSHSANCGDSYAQSEKCRHFDGEISWADMNRRISLPGSLRSSSGSELHEARAIRPTVGRPDMLVKTNESLRPTCHTVRINLSVTARRSDREKNRQPTVDLRCVHDVRMTNAKLTDAVERSGAAFGPAPGSAIAACSYQISVNVLLNDALRQGLPRPLFLDAIRKRSLRGRRHIVDDYVGLRGVALK